MNAQSDQSKDKYKGRQARIDVSRRLNAYYATVMTQAAADAEDFLDRVLKRYADQHSEDRNPEYPLT